MLKMDESFAGRYLNDGFSGGEKKRAEILQMAMLKPEIAIMDETDSGLDIDALRIVSEGVNALAGPGPGRARDHALPAHSQLHQAAPRPRHGGRAHPPVGRRRPGAPARSQGLRLGARSQGSGDTMSTTPEHRRSRQLRGEVRLPRRGRIRFQVPQGPRPRDRRADLEDEGRAAVDADYRLKALEIFEKKPMPTWGGDVAADRLPGHLLLREADREGSQVLGGRAGRHEAHVRQARHSRGRAEVPLRRRRAVRLRGRLPQDQGEAREAGRDLPVVRSRPAGSTRSCSSSTSAP